MKSKSSGKNDNGLRVADGWIAVKVCPRSEEAIFGTLRATRKESRDALSVLLQGEVRRSPLDKNSDQLEAKRRAINTAVWKGTYEDIQAGVRRFRIAYARGTWWPA